MTRPTTAFIDAIAAKSVSDALYDMGYPATPENCNDYVYDVVRYFAGSDPDAQHEVRHNIDLVLGLTQPLCECPERECVHAAREAAEYAAGNRI